MSAVKPAVGAALPGEPCREFPHDSWSDLEKWVWQEIGSGRIADINAHLGKTADPRNPDDWGPDRRLSPAFLETILLHDPWQGAIPRQGVHISGALFDTRIDLVEVDIAHVFGLVRSRFTSDVHFQRMRAKSALSVGGSVISGTLDMNSANIGGSLFMRAGAEFREVILRDAQIGGQLDLSNAKIVGTLYMEAARVGGSLLMREGAEFAEIALRGAQIGSQIDLTDAKVTGTLEMDSATIRDALLMRGHAEFAEIVLRAAQIGSQLDLSSAKVTGAMNMDSVTIGGALLMRRSAEFVDIRLAGARVGGQFDMTGAKVTGAMNMDSASVGGDLFLFDGQFSKPVSLIFTKIGGNLDLRGAALAGLDLTGAQVGSELRLASRSRRPNWGGAARLVLRNTCIASVQDEPEAWPRHLSLGGFTYESFGGFGATEAASIAKRGSDWFKAWLARDEPYTPQPYQRCAKVLREMGHPEMAGDVLYAGRERERGESRRRRRWRWFGLSLLNWTIGYGYGLRYFRSLWWVLGFVIVGTMFLFVSGQIDKVGGSLTDGVFYSFDLLLPIIQLYEPHYKIVLDGFAKYYFAAHKLMGYVLASFLIAGLAGLTK